MPRRKSAQVLTPEQRRQMWNQMAEDLEYVAHMILYCSKLPFEHRELLERRILIISLMIRVPDPGHPLGEGRGKAQIAADEVAERVRQRRKIWLSENRRRKLPEKELQRMIEEESEVQWKVTHIRPHAEAVLNAYRRGGPEPQMRSRDGFLLNSRHLNARRQLEEIWLARHHEKDLHR